MAFVLPLSGVSEKLCLVMVAFPGCQPPTYFVAIGTQFSDQRKLISGYAHVQAAELGHR